ncbi:MAG: CRISPR-associated protein Cas4 [Chloroflexaceae bacterium]|nr:CRISPR-associated protein Cas4 [Chloroflexaceae bacterium]
MTTIQREPELIPLAMLNALAYCPRRFVYEFVQGEMLLNAHVVEGTLRHAAVDGDGTVWRGDVVQHRRVYVWSERLRIGGVCDVVEEMAGQLQPVEYKKGKPGRWQSDHVQLCGQALCLEERTGQVIAQGAIFYFAARRREVVEFTPELRARTEQVVADAHALVASGVLPPPVEQRAKCRECSLEPLCMPRLAEQLERWRAGGEEGG